MPKRDENKDIRNFALALAVILAAFAALGFYRERDFWPYLAVVAGALVPLAFFGRPLLRPIFRGWMWLANKLNWVMTRVILTLAWLILFVPIGLILRLFRVDFFDRKWSPEQNSYWRERADKSYDRKKTERLG